MSEMTLEEWRDVLRDMAMNQVQMIGLPSTDAQKGTVCWLFKQFCDEANVETLFAADDAWFRHETMKLLWGHSSTKKLDMATVSTMISEIGTKEGGDWQLTDRGIELLYLVMDRLEEMHPTQLPLV